MTLAGACRYACGVAVTAAMVLMFARGVVAGDFASGHVIVKLRPAAAAGLSASTRAGCYDQVRASLGLPGGAKLVEPGITGYLRGGRPAAKTAAEEAREGLARFMYLNLPPGLSPDDCVRLLSGHPLVEYAEMDGVGSGHYIPNDTSFSDQWHHTNITVQTACISTPRAWDLTVGTTGTLVAVLDTGLTMSDEFTNRVVAGYNFAYTNSDTTDDQGHGSSVAGMIAANADNAFLVAGVDWRCRIMPIKVLDSGNYGLYSWWAQGVDYAVANGAKIINLSAGGVSSNQTLTAAITNALSNGVIFVTTAGNNGTNSVTFPGNLKLAITVGATDILDRKTGFSNWGPQVDLCAPGTNIVTVSRFGALSYRWGTSFAAPQVAGVCGLMLSLRPGLSHAQARLLLCAGAEDGVGDANDTPGYDNYYGWGRMNAYNSVILATTEVDGSYYTNGTFIMSWPAPDNAWWNEPYQVQYKDAMDASWTTVTATTDYAYLDGHAYWADTNATAASRFYRVVIRSLE